MLFIAILSSLILETGRPMTLSNTHTVCTLQSVLIRIISLQQYAYIQYVVNVSLVRTTYSYVPYIRMFIVNCKPVSLPVRYKDYLNS